MRDRNRNFNLDALRTVATLMIVVHHTPGGGVISFFDWTVPIFFALSGYLMFLNYRHDLYVRKLTNRISRLIVPFFVWNIVFLSCFLLASWLLPELAVEADGGHEHNCLWIIGKALGFSYEPGDPPLWYLRTLVGLSISSPLIYTMLKSRMGLMVCLGIGGVWWTCEFVFNFRTYMHVVFPAYSFIMFSIGGWFSLTNRQLDEFCFKYRRIILPLFFGITSLRYMGWIPEWFYILSYLVTILAWFSVARYFGLLMKFKKFRYLSDHSFFIYAIHFLFVPVEVKVLLLTEISEFIGNGSLYRIIGGIIGVSLCVISCVLLDKFCNPILKLLNGQGLELSRK